MSEALCAAVIETVKLNARRKDGSTLRENYEHAERQTGKRLFDEPEPPEEAAHVWEWFWELDAARGGNGFGLNPLSWEEIAAWADLNGVRPEQMELRLIKAMDAARLKASAEVK